MTKITAEHLARTACVYIRQSTADQLVHNKESQRRQYALADRARQLGWTGVEIVDDDLGRSGGGVARPGFDRLIGAICAGDVGAVLAIEASRLARNGRDWHMLIEFCGLVATIIVDEDGIAEEDAKRPNRERDCLVGERTRIVNRIKSTLARLGIRNFNQPCARRPSVLQPCTPGRACRCRQTPWPSCSAIWHGWALLSARSERSRTLVRND
jgi:hypothetical protein